MINNTEENCLILSHIKQPYYDFHIEAFGEFFKSVTNFYYIDYFVRNSIRDLESEINSIIKEKEITYIILWQWYSNYVPRLEYLQRLREKIFIVLWLFDDDVFFHTHGKFYAQVCDVVVTTDYFGKIMYEQLNIPSIYYVGAYDKNIYFPINIEKDIDVSFVGGIDTGDRREYLEFLIDNGINVEIYGENTKNGYITQSDMVRIFNRSKINLNFTKIAFSMDVFDDNPLISRIRQNKGRPVEIGLTKSFCLSESSPSLSKLFDRKSEIDTFDSKEELLNKIKFYLDNEELRSNYSHNLYNKCISLYEKEIYFKNIFSQLNQIQNSKNVNKINYYGIERNTSFKIKEKSYFFRHAMVQLIKYKNISSFVQSFRQLLDAKFHVIIRAVIYTFKKFKTGESK